MRSRQTDDRAVLIRRLAGWAAGVAGDCRPGWPPEPGYSEIRDAVSVLGARDPDVRRPFATWLRTLAGGQLLVGPGSGFDEPAPVTTLPQPRK